MQAHLWGALLVLVLVPACASSSAPVEAKPDSAATTTPPPAATPASPASPASTAATSPADPNVCPLGKSDTWKACVGKLVEVRGQTPKMVNQHPMMAPPAGPPGSTGPAMHQEYLDTAEGSQIIVLTRNPSKCAGAMRVKGTLRAIDLGGPAGTKESYQGWSIDDATIFCE